MSGRAVLWRKRHKGQKVIARAVLAALIGVVVTPGGHGNGRDASPYRIKTEIRPARIPEQVAISDVSIIVNSSVGIRTLYFGDFIGGKFPAKSSGSECVLLESQNTNARFRVFWDTEVEIGWQWERQNFGFCVNDYIVCRREPRIEKMRLKFEINFVCLLDD